jgi:hypothetical protein
MTITFALYYNTWDRSKIEFAQVLAKLTEEEAAALPKFLKFVPGNRQYTYTLKANGTNGSVNESALKKLAKVFAIPGAKYGTFYRDGERSPVANEVPEDVARKMVGL